MYELHIFQTSKAESGYVIKICKGTKLAGAVLLHWKIIRQKSKHIYHDSTYLEARSWPDQYQYRYPKPAAI